MNEGERMPIHFKFKIAWVILAFFVWLTTVPERPEAIHIKGPPQTAFTIPPLSTNQTIIPQPK